MNMQRANQVTNTQTETHEPDGDQSDLAQFLTFRLGQEQYGIDILRIQEIRGWAPVSRVPNVTRCEKGVLNLRGTIVPVIDLRERLGFEPVEYNAITAVIVVRVRQADQSKIMGMVVDEVSDVADVEMPNLQNAPDFGEKVSTEFISSLATEKDRMIRILNVDKLMQLNGDAESG